MAFGLDHAALLDRLEDDIRCAAEPCARLFSEIIAAVIAPGYWRSMGPA
jgi:hypothetical protein